MSGATLPTGVMVTQNDVGPYVTITDSSALVLPPGVPPYPLAADPGQNWVLQDENGTLNWVLVNTLDPLTISAPSTATAGIPFTVSGTVYPPADAVNFALSSSATIPPVVGLVEASNVGGALSAELTPAAAGTFYVWAIDNITGRTVVSGPVTAGLNAVALSFNPVGSGTYSSVAGGTISLDGNLTPAQTVALQVTLSTSNTGAPRSGWTVADLQPGDATWAAYPPVPGTPGTYYAWIQTTEGTCSAVSTFTITVT